MKKNNNIFVMSDIHGRYDLMKDMLNNWNPDTEDLILLGDLCDRGPNTKECFEKALELKETKGAIVVLGNHEEMLYNFLTEPIEYSGIYLMNGGLTTIASLLGLKDTEEAAKLDVATIPEAIIEINPWIMDYLKGLTRKYEWEQYVFVHAGVNLTLSDWRESSNFDLTWIREGFIDMPNKFPETFVFGHTPTPNLHADSSNFSIWQESGKVGIDGAAVYGGQLNGVVFSKDGIEKVYKVK